MNTSAWMGTTSGPRGSVAITHAQARLASGGSLRHELVLQMPMREGRAVRLDPKAWPEKPVVLQMPPVGRVPVRMAEAPQSWARIRPLPAGGERGMWWSADSRSEPFVQGRAQFPFVEVGLELQVQAWWEGGVAPASLVRTGPTKAGEEVLVEIDAEHGPGGLTLDEQDV